MTDPAPLLSSTDTMHFAGIEERLGFWGGVVSLLVSMVGTGIAAFPYAFSLCGYVVGPTIFIIVCVLPAYISYVMLVNCTKKMEVASYGEMIKRVSIAWAYYANLSLWVLFILVVAAYVIISADIVSGIAPHLLGQGSFLTMALKDEVLFAFILLLQFPICLFKSFKGLSFITTYCSCILFVIVMLIIYKSYDIYINNPPLKSEVATASFELQNVFLAVPMLACAMFGHMNISQIYAELQPQVKTHASRLVLVACGAAAAIYVTIGMVGFAAFGKETQSDIVKQISTRSGEDVVVISIQALLANFIVFKTPLMIVPLRTLSIQMLAPTANPMELAAWKHTGLTFGLLVCTYIACMTLPQLGTVLAVLGAVCIIPITFVVPARMSWSIEVPRPVVQCCALSVTGVILSVVSLAVFVGL